MLSEWINPNYTFVNWDLYFDINGHFYFDCLGDSFSDSFGGVYNFFFWLLVIHDAIIIVATQEAQNS